MPTTYRITQTTTGVVLDEIDAATPLDAYRVHMARVGYPTEADAQSAGYTIAEIPADMAVEEVEEDELAADPLPRLYVVRAGQAYEIELDAERTDGYAAEASNDGVLAYAEHKAEARDLAARYDRGEIQPDNVLIRQTGQTVAALSRALVGATA